MKQRNYRTSSWVEVKPHGNKKHKPKLGDVILLGKNMPLGVVTEKQKDGWYEVQIQGISKVKLSK